MKKMEFGTAYWNLEAFSADRTKKIEKQLEKWNKIEKIVKHRTIKQQKQIKK